MPPLVNCWSSADDVTPARLTERLRSGGVITADTSVASVTHHPVGIGVGILALLWRRGVRYPPEGAVRRSMILQRPQASAVARDLAKRLRICERWARLAGHVATVTP